MRHKFNHECIFHEQTLEKLTTALLVVDDSCHIKLLFSSRSKPGRRPLDVVFSFDTTLSMVGVIERVRQDIEFIATRLFKDIPDLRLAVFAHGDYDTPNYIIQCLDFTDNTQEVVRVGYMRYQTYMHIIRHTSICKKYYFLCTLNTWPAVSSGYFSMKAFSGTAEMRFRGKKRLGKPSSFAFALVCLT